MARVTVPLRNATRNINIATRLQWIDTTNGLGSGTDIGVLVPSLSSAVLTRLQIDSALGSDSLLYVTGPGQSWTGSGQDLVTSWETGLRSIILQCDGISDDLVIPGPNNDTNRRRDPGETYSWGPPATTLTAVAAWITAYRALTAMQQDTARVILDDGVADDRTETDTIYTLATSAPAAPTGGTDSENDQPAGWTRIALSPTATQNVYSAERTRTYMAGAFVSATAWGNVTEVAEAGGTSGRTFTEYLLNVQFTWPGAGGTHFQIEEDHGGARSLQNWVPKTLYDDPGITVGGAALTGAFIREYLSDRTRLTRWRVRTRIGDDTSANISTWSNWKTISIAATPIPPLATAPGLSLSLDEDLISEEGEEDVYQYYIDITVTAPSQPSSGISQYSYRIEISTSRNFAGKQTITRNRTDRNNVGYSFDTGLRSDEGHVINSVTYYVRVFAVLTRSGGGTVNTPYSATKSIDV